MLDPTNYLFGLIIIALCTITFIFCLYVLYRVKKLEHDTSTDMIQLGRQHSSAVARLKREWTERLDSKFSVLQVAGVELTAEPFVKWPCPCGTELHLNAILEPGQAAVVNCENCGTSHSVYLPSLQIKPTEEFDLVWPFTKKEGVKDERAAKSS